MNRREILRYAALAAGGAIASPFASALLMGCERDQAMLEEGYKTTFLNDQEYQYLTRLADTMLPKDDYPSASEVGVPEMIDKIVGEVYSVKDQNEFRAGLKALMGEMDADNPGGFAKLDNDAALVYLQDQDLHYKTGKVTTKMSGEDVPREEIVMDESEGLAKKAYFDLKGMIIGTYFNTEEIATSDLLVYQPVPGEYIPCGDLQELTGGRSWAI